MSEDREMDPGPPGDAPVQLRAKDLIGFGCIFVPRELGEWPAREATDDERAKGPSPFVECDVHTVDRSGVLDSASFVRVSWVRVYPQLAEKIGRYIAARPMKQDDNSIILEALDAETYAAAEKVVAELKKVAASVAEVVPVPEGEEVF